MIDDQLVTDVKTFLDSGDRSFVDRLKELDRNSIQGQSVVRYLIQLKHWHFTPGCEFNGVLDHFFAAYPERKSVEPTEYQTTTAALIKQAFDYECLAVITAAEVKEKKPNPGKVTRRPKMVKEEDDQYAKSTDINTDGASDRLKKVIAIQRGQ